MNDLLPHQHADEGHGSTHKTMAELAEGCKNSPMHHHLHPSLTEKEMNNDVALARYFIPASIRHIPIRKTDELKYLEWSSNGKHKTDIKLSGFSDGFNALIAGKQWAGRTMHELWEAGVLEGTVPYFTLLGGEDNKPIPRFIVDFMKGEMFKGTDAEIIENCYQKIIKASGLEDTPIWDLVIEDMKARDKFGWERYGKPLVAHNGTDPLQEAYEEALDLCVYLRQAIEERKNP